MRDGKLPNTKDTRWRPVTRDWPVFGFAVDLGSVWSAPVETLFSLGVAQVEAIDFQGMRRQIVPNLWTSYFKTELESVC